ncbi:ATP-binding protein [Aquihabitans sp. McL0605]|uniref:ATP-binding protein n=1 Tax=Aquihabitans sp. McL0605 TaxID=3415671 RepID=UPI003CF7A522
MEFMVLGPVQLVGPAGNRINLASDAQRRLVSHLVLRANTIVRSEELEDHLGLSPGALRTSVSRLRRVVGFDTLLTAAPGYELRTDSIDAARFERLLDEARTTGDCSQARLLLEAALDQWRGVAYAEFAHEPWAEVEAHRLGELRAAATEELVANLVASGEWARALAHLDPLIAEHAFRDRPRALQMEALAGSGRQLDALRSYQEYRRMLLDEVGTEPSPDLVALDRAIASAPTSAGHGLPAPWSSFIGRDADTATVAALSDAHRLVTLTGAGGCGKTRLALQAARRRAQRTTPSGRTETIHWVELASVVASDQVVERVAMATGLHAAGDDGLIEQLTRHIDEQRPALLILDNAEHVLTAVACLAERVLRGSTGCRIVVTSREPLGLPGELVWQVPALSLPHPAQPGPATSDDLQRSDAARLLLDRVAAARPGLRIEPSSIPAVITICHQLDGLPLAIELAAASIRTMSLERLAADLERTLAPLDRGSPADVSHHQTMRASIAWSVAQLDERERLVLHRLAVFASPFGEQAAEAVGSDGEIVDRAGVHEALGRLVDKGLVQLDEATNRYRLLQTTRHACLDLGRAAEVDGARHRHARYLAGWCTSVGTGARGIDRAPFVRAMPEVVAAMDWARVHDPEAVMQMCRGLASVRSMLGHAANLRDTWDWLMAFDRDGELAAEWAGAVAAQMAAATGAGYDITGLAAEVAARLDPADEQAQVWLARGRAMIPAYRGDLGPARRYADRIIAGGNDLEISVYVGFAAYMSAVCGVLDDTDRWLDELRRMTLRQRVAFSVDTVGNGYAAEVMSATARGRLAEACARSIGPVPRDPAFTVSAVGAVGRAAVLAGDRAALDRVQPWLRPNPIAVLHHLVVLDELHRVLVAGDHELASILAEQYWEETALVPACRVQPQAMLNVPLLATGRHAVVRAMVEEDERLVGEMGPAPLLAAEVLLGRAQLALATDDLEGAAAAACALLHLAEVNRFPLLSIDARGAQAEIAARQGDPIGARRLAEETTAERARLGYRFEMVPTSGVGAAT